MKQCYKCGELKNENDFYGSKFTKDGLLAWCKKCYKNYIIWRNSLPENRKKLLEYQKKYQNKPEIKKLRLEQSSKIRLRHPEMAVKKYFETSGLDLSIVPDELFQLKILHIITKREIDNWVSQLKKEAET